MKKIQIFLLGITLVFSKTLAQNVPKTDIIIGEKQNIFSAILKENRSYWVYLPPDYNDSQYAPQRFPVVYLLDGDSHFHSLTGIQQFLSKGPYARLPQMIVVGILNTDRSRDLTPTHDNVVQLNGQQASFPTSGGGENFVQFLKNELIPHIDATYRTTTYRTLIGHSFGGLTTVSILLNHTDLFNAYIAIDPSLWWHKQQLVSGAEQILSQKKFEGRTFYMALANKAISVGDTSTEHPQAIRKFVSLLEKQSTNGLRWNWRYFDDEDHGSISLPAEYYGLKFLFSGYQLPVRDVAEQPELLLKSFRNLSTQLHVTMVPTESQIDWYATYCQRNKQSENALTFLKMNIDTYPKSPNAHRSLGDFYAQQGNKSDAIRCYQQALQLNPADKSIEAKLQLLK